MQVEVNSGIGLYLSKKYSQDTINRRIEEVFRAEFMQELQRQLRASIAQRFAHHDLERFTLTHAHLWETIHHQYREAFRMLEPASHKYRLKLLFDVFYSEVGPQATFNDVQWQIATNVPYTGTSIEGAQAVFTRS